MDRQPDAPANAAGHGPERQSGAGSQTDGRDQQRAQTLPLCEFDAERCKAGIEALKQYQKTWDDKLQRFSDLPLHNWASDPADSFRYLCVAWREAVLPAPKTPDRILSVGNANQISLRDLDKLSNLNWRR
jgi:hypothetical protein